MTQEVKILKNRLRYAFPENKTAFSVVDSSSTMSDMIKIKTDIPYDDVVSCLEDILKGIVCFPKNAKIPEDWSCEPAIGDFTDTIVRSIEIDSSM